MRKMMLGLLAACCTMTQLAAQNGTQPVRKTEYTNAIGIRAGTTSGLTYKHFMNTSDAVEIILGIWPNAVGVTGLYEKHVSAGVPALKFYYGGGAHVTAETNRYYYYRYGKYRGEYIYRYGRNGLAIGVDGVVGLDFKIPVIPVALSIDLKPFLEVTTFGDVYTAIDPSLGVKIAF